MLLTEDLFIYVYVLIDDVITARAIVILPRPGPAPGCTNAELLTIGVVRHLLGRRSEAGFLAELAATGHTCSRACRTSPRRTGESLAVGRLRAVPQDAGGLAARR